MFFFITPALHIAINIIWLCFSNAKRPLQLILSVCPSHMTRSSLECLSRLYEHLFALLLQDYHLSIGFSSYVVVSLPTFAVGAVVESLVAAVVSPAATAASLFTIRWISCTRSDSHQSIIILM